MSNQQLEVTRDQRNVSVGKWNLIINKFGVYGIVLLFLLIGPMISSKFMTFENLSNIVQAVALLGIVSVGMAFVTYSGHFADMSVPSIMAFSGIISISTLKFGIAISLLAGLAAGLLIGVVNAWVVAKYRANPIIWTLAVAYVMNGLMRMIWSGNQIYPDSSPGSAGSAFIHISRIQWGKVPLTLILFFLIVIFGQMVLTKTQFGQQLKLIGSSIEVARLTGVNVVRTVGLAFLISALAASIAGILVTSLVKIGVYYNGQGYDFNAVTGVVVGGMTLAGGRGSILGVLGGVLVMGLMDNIMTLLGIDTFSQTIVQGIIFILVVGINAKSLRKLGRDDA